MAIFKKKLSRNSINSIFVGANVPLQINTYITLYSIVTELSKQKIIIDLCNKFKEENKDEMPLDYLINRVAEKGREILELESKEKGFSKTKFIQDINKDLTKKGIETKVRQLILKKIIDEKEQ